MQEFPPQKKLLFLQNVRDNTHRFAIGRHRRARQGAALSGELMRLPGIGPATARLLWDNFGSVEAMRAASVDDLCKISGIGPAKAALLREKLRGSGRHGIVCKGLLRVRRELQEDGGRSLNS